MKVSLCSTWFKSKKIDEVIEIAQKYDFDGIELWSDHIRDFLGEGNRLSDLQALLEKASLTVCCISPYLNFTKSQEDAKRSKEEAIECIRYARGLNAGLIRIFVGNIPSKDMKDDQWDRSIDCLKEICSLEQAIDFGLETHYNQPTDRIESILFLLEKVDIPNLKVIFDGFNFVVDQINQLEALNILFENIVHIHMKNYEWATKTPLPIHIGDADNLSILKELKKRNYKGFISLEYFKDDYHELIKTSIEQIKEVGLYD